MELIFVLICVCSLLFVDCNVLILFFIWEILISTSSLLLSTLVDRDKISLFSFITYPSNSVTFDLVLRRELFTFIIVEFNLSIFVLILVIWVFIVFTND